MWHDKRAPNRINTMSLPGNIKKSNCDNLAQVSVMLCLAAPDLSVHKSKTPVRRFRPRLSFVHFGLDSR